MIQDETERTQEQPEEEAPASRPEADASVAQRAPGPEALEGEREERGRATGERRRRYFGRRRVCAFCAEKVRAIDYKDPVRLRRYLSDRARIDPRRRTGTCAKHQRWLAVALKRARHLALLPYTPEHIRQTGVFAARR